MQILYLDIDNIAYEGIRSGATIGNIEILKEFIHQGCIGTIYEIYNDKDSNLDRNSNKLNIIKQIDGINVNMIKFNLENIRKRLEREDYELILYSIPSVFFTEKDYYLLDILKKYSKILMLVIADNFYPTRYSINNDDIYYKYIKILKESSIITKSKFLQNKIKNEMCINSNLLYPYIRIDLNKKIKKDTSNKKYITFINPVKLKGIDLFERIIDMNPDMNFLIVKGWGETDTYKYDKQNVSIIDFQTDMSNVWSKAKILLVLSVCHEVYGRVVSEAILNNTKVICNKIGGIPEAANGKAVLVEPLKNYGTEIYPKFNEKELNKKAKELTRIIKHEDKCMDNKKIEEDRLEMLTYIKNNNEKLKIYVQSIISNIK